MGLVTAQTPSNRPAPFSAVSATPIAGRQLLDDFNRATQLTQIVLFTMRKQRRPKLWSFVYLVAAEEHATKPVTELKNDDACCA